MFVDSKDFQIIRRLIPLATLSESCFEKLCAACHIEEVPRGAVLFREGDNKNEFVYLLGGKVVLQAGDVEMDTIEGGSETARFALAHQIPRKVSAIAKNKVRFIRVDAQLLHIPEEKDMRPTSTSYQVSDIPQESAHDWMSALLRLPFFQRLPAANLQKLLMELEEVRVKSGDRVIVQGEPVEYYYIIKKGRCALSRKASEQAKEIVLAKLRTCDTFGEDALISGEPSQVSATMWANSTLMRLDKSKFLQLIKEPVLHSVDFKTVRQDLLQTSVLIDVRPPEEFGKKHFKGSINMPFFSLPMQLVKLDKNRLHIVVCDNGKISETGAFLLIRNACNAVVLKGGLNKVPEKFLFLAPRDETFAPLTKERGNASLENKQAWEASPAKDSLHQTYTATTVEPPADVYGEVSEGEQYPLRTQEEQRSVFSAVETSEQTEKFTLLSNHVSTLEQERDALKCQLEKHRQQMADSHNALQEKLQSVLADCQSQKDGLTEQSNVISDLQSTIQALRKTNAGLEQQIHAQTTDEDEKKERLDALRAEREVIRR